NLFDEPYSDIRKFEPKKKTVETSSFKPKANMKPVAQAKITNQSNGEDVELAADKIVVHDRFGRGKVIRLEGEPGNVKATILFDHAGEKKLLLNFAKLKVLE